MCRVSVVSMENKYLHTIDFTPAATGRFAASHPNTRISQKALNTEAKWRERRNTNTWRRCGGCADNSCVHVLHYYCSARSRGNSQRLPARSWHTEGKDAERKTDESRCLIPRRPGNVDQNSAAFRAAEAAETLCGQQRRLFRGQRTVIYGALRRANQCYKTCNTLTQFETNWHFGEKKKNILTRAVSLTQ